MKIPEIKTAILPAVTQTLTKQTGYHTLGEIVNQIKITHEQFQRGMIKTQGGLLHSKQETVRWWYGLLGKEFEIPDVTQTIHLQQQNLQKYIQCLDLIAKNTSIELSNVETHINNLLERNEDLSQRRDSSYTKLQQLLDEYADISGSRSEILTKKRALINESQEYGLALVSLKTGDISVTQLLALETLLADSLFTAKKLKVEGTSYQDFIQQAIRPYFALGLYASHMTELKEGMLTMQEFTFSIEKNVSEAMSQLHEHAYHTHPSLPNVLQKTAATLQADTFSSLASLEKCSP